MTESPLAVESDSPHALAGEGLAAVAEVDAAVRQGTLSGFESPESGQAVAAPVDEASATSPVAAATTARRPPRAKRAAAPAVAETAAPGVAEVRDSAGAAVAEPSFAAEPAERVEPTGFASEAAPAATEPDALTPRLDALQGALAEQRRMALASSRQQKWVLAAATMAVLASAGFGIAQSMRLDSLANESRADEARLEQFILKQQATLDDLAQRVAAQTAAAATATAAATAAAETPAAAPARLSPRAAPAKASPAPAHRAAAHATHAPHAKSAQKTTR
ncbi:hypothetical protein M3I53_31700 [Paraburkholderia sp. CNPSo 3272]|uniref:hypothetical protein n=1 Tax=Paraburkholderia sp. CNPSo 3272 TaxID=2940931 RepID=UPI0020B67EAA|nr:hypothetical protein [Paraburkholderia sp. CNPSo 3272]MCP3727634.1 hypothetical protein [Paraburkholderia sp. CNPSo 3272]